jgi:hypothetical protein
MHSALDSTLVQREALAHAAHDADAAWLAHEATALRRRYGGRSMRLAPPAARDLAAGLSS